MPRDADDAPCPEVCFGLWITEDHTRALRVDRAPDGAVRVSVWRRRDLAAHLVDRPATWHPPVASAARSADAKSRVGFLQVEVGDPGLGTTYDLMVACPAAHDSGFAWGPLTDGVARDAVRIFPQGGASYYEAVLGAWDDVVEDLRAADAWMQPLSTWRPASDDDARREPAPVTA